MSFLGHVPVWYTLGNTFVTMVEVYFLPFLVIVLCYGIMFWKFARQTDAGDVMTEVASSLDDSAEDEVPLLSVPFCLGFPIAAS